MADRINVYVDPELDALGPHEMRAVRVAVVMKDGTIHTEESNYRPGHWRNPISDADLKAKFEDLAGRAITAQGIAKIEALLDNLENEQEPAPLFGAALQMVR